MNRTLDHAHLPLDELLFHCLYGRESSPLDRANPGLQAVVRRPGNGLTGPDLDRVFFNGLEHSSWGYFEDAAISETDSNRLIAIFDLCRRYSLHRESYRRHILHGRVAEPEHPEGIWSRIPEVLQFAPKEWLGFIPRYQNGKIGRLCVVENGTRTHVNLDVKELFARILSVRPDGFFLIHNHPSGDLRASEEDLSLTRQMEHLSEQLGVQMLGHGIVGPLGERWIARSA